MIDLDRNFSCSIFPERSFEAIFNDRDPRDIPLYDPVYIFTTQTLFDLNIDYPRAFNPLWFPGEDLSLCSLTYRRVCLRQQAHSELFEVDPDP